MTALSSTSLLSPPSLASPSATTSILDEVCVLLIKPEALSALTEIRTTVLSAGFRILREKQFRFTPARVHRFYSHLYGRSFFFQLIEHMLSNDCAVLILHDPKNSPDKIRKLLGPEDPHRAKTQPNSLRCWYGIDRLRNGLTASQSARETLRQYDCIFPLLRRTVIAFGPPAVGKGTQCSLLSEAFHLPHIDAGDLLRHEMKKSTPQIEELRKLMAAGALLPDSFVWQCVKQRLNSSDTQLSGWILDGFPRSEEQAKVLIDSGLEISRLVFIRAENEQLIQRITGRRFDPTTGKTYHLTYAPPPTKEIAARCIQRMDDSEEVVRRRLAIYYSSIGAILAQFKDVYTVMDNTFGANRKNLYATSRSTTGITSALPSEINSPQAPTSRVESDWPPSEPPALSGGIAWSIWHVFHQIVQALEPDDKQLKRLVQLEEEHRGQGKQLRKLLLNVSEAGMKASTIAVQLPNIAIRQKSSSGRHRLQSKF